VIPRAEDEGWKTEFSGNEADSRAQWKGVATRFIHTKNTKAPPKGMKLALSGRC